MEIGGNADIQYGTVRYDRRARANFKSFGRFRAVEILDHGAGKFVVAVRVILGRSLVSALAASRPFASAPSMGGSAPLTEPKVPERQ